MIRLFLVLCLVFACGRARKPNIAIPSEELKKKADLYLSEMERDEHGFIMAEGCDSTIFSGLLGAATLDVDLQAAASLDLKQWYRRPGKDCSPSLGNSRSTVSRDMILGVMWWAWRTKNLEVVHTLLKDLKGRAYYLRGEGTPGELWMNPAMMNTLAHVVLRLGGPRYSLELGLPVVFGKDTGYIAHLTVWHILLRGELNKEISGGQFDILEYHARRNPLNPLFVAAYDKYNRDTQDRAIGLLLDGSEWPINRLPSTKEHCAPWPIQRDYKEKDWGPCTPYRKHTGAELVIVYHLVIAQ